RTRADAMEDFDFTSSGSSGGRDSGSITSANRPPASSPYWEGSGVCKATLEVMAGEERDAGGEAATKWPNRSSMRVFPFELPPELSKGTGVGGEGLDILRGRDRRRGHVRR